MDSKKKQELGKVFEGRYTDPNHPGGYRDITMLDEWKEEVATIEQDYYEVTTKIAILYFTTQITPTNDQLQPYCYQLVTIRLPLPFLR